VSERILAQSLYSILHTSQIKWGLHLPHRPFTWPRIATTHTTNEPLETRRLEQSPIGPSPICMVGLYMNYCWAVVDQYSLSYCTPMVPRARGRGQRPQNA